MEWFESIYEIIVRISLATVFVWFFIFPAPNRVLKANRSKNGYKKLKKTFSIWDRILRRRYIENTKVCIGYQWFFIIANYVGYFCIIVFFVLCIISAFTHNFVEIMKPYAFIKACFIELPLLVFTLLKYRGVNTLRKRGYWTMNWSFLLPYDKKAQNYYKNYDK